MQLLSVGHTGKTFKEMYAISDVGERRLVKYFFFFLMVL